MQCQSRVRNVLGDKHDELYPKILQLVMADGAYCEGKKVERITLFEVFVLKFV